MSVNGEGRNPETLPETLSKAEINELAGKIEEKISSMLIRIGFDRREISHELARQILVWKARGGEGPGNKNEGFANEPLRNYAESLYTYALDAYHAFNKMNKALGGPDWIIPFDLCDRYDPVSKFVLEAASKKGLGSSEVEKAIDAIWEGINDAKETGIRLQRDWAKDYGGNKIKARARLRLWLNEVLFREIKPRRTRARIIAAAFVVSGVIGKDEESSELNRVVSTLQRNNY